MVKYTVKESQGPIPEGKHKAKIVDIQYRHDPHEYTDIMWEFTADGNQRQVKYGCPSTLSEESRLGKLCLIFGIKLVPGEEIDIEKELIGKQGLIYTINEPSKKDPTREFARITKVAALK